MGDVVLQELLRERDLAPVRSAGLDVVVLIGEEGARAESLGLVQRLRSAGLAVDYSLTPTKPDRQFKRALELEAVHTALLERADTGDWRVRIRHLSSRAETVVPLDGAAAAFQRKQAGGVGGIAV
jgi:histidyl-tRNA synthetase